MDKWITLLTFKNPAEAHLIKTKLESERIRVFLKNEYTAQLVPHGSEPGGPIKMQIHKEDVSTAVKLLKENGYLKEEKTRLPHGALIQSIGMVTSKIPGFRNKPFQLRLILAIAVVLVVITLVVSLMLLPSSV